jgi:molybdopterin-containing oxidoreductase family iron-sulfur binding subunit
LPVVEANEAGMVLNFKFDPNIQDGQHANNGWLQEIPKPITKIVWDNGAYVSLKDAESLKLSNGDLIKLSADNVNITAPVWVLPGQAEGAITLSLGFGRESAGKVGNGVGVNAYLLRQSANVWNTPIEVTKVSGHHKLVTTQYHHDYEGTTERRHIVRHGTLEEFKAHPEHPEFVHPVEHHESDLYDVFEYDSYAWGMVIDMSVCTGCNACVTACQSENNIPIVGKHQVEVGREMHWIRVDTYYGGNPDNPEFYMQPINCMHCEQAPCEPVCPVGATVHDTEGLNVMVYNRCVGTRYCSNNCPYKVRRYNFLQFAELTTNATELSLAQNPDVTVRSRGVMEKCSYCVQRIQEAYINSENEGRSIADGEVVTACQSACPMEAIVFGDINNSESAVAKNKASKLNYALLEELNTRPRTTYLAKLTNPNSALAGEESGVHS